MFNATISQIAFLLGALGLFVGAVALIVAIEVARRSQEYLRKHAQEMNLTLSKRIQEQDKHLGDALQRFRGQLNEFERSDQERGRQVSEMNRGLELRFANQEGIVNERVRAAEGRIGAVEKLSTSYVRQISVMRQAIKDLSYDVSGIVSRLTPVPPPDTAEPDAEPDAETTVRAN
ncbi:MAG: hypothetical protein RIC16_13875 [Rhodospirillales bacterium]